MELEKLLDPFKLFNEWFEQAKQKELRDPNAMQLATVAEDGMPSIRTVLLKDIIDRKFVFYTNYESRKSKEIFKTKKVALCFYWKSLNRQVRIVGGIEKLSEVFSDKYFHSRSAGSRIGAWASDQSRPLESRDTLMKKVKFYQNKFKTKIPRPKNWGGFLIDPLEFEFWQDGEFRLHDRFKLKPSEKPYLWETMRMYP